MFKLFRYTIIYGTLFMLIVPNIVYSNWMINLAITTLGILPLDVGWLKYNVGGVIALSMIISPLYPYNPDESTLISLIVVRLVSYLNVNELSFIGIVFRKQLLLINTKNAISFLSHSLSGFEYVSRNAFHWHDVGAFLPQLLGNPIPGSL